MRRILAILTEAFRQFIASDGWAIASHIALSSLMALFPFLIVLTTIAGFLGSKYLADEAANILLETWPKEVASSLASEIHSVLTSTHGGILTLSAALAIYFASSGVEGLRIGLNRAYSVADERPWWLLRLESIGFVLLGAVALLAVSFLVVLAPLIWRTALRYMPGIEPFAFIITFTRFAVASVVAIVALTVMHLWLPAGRRRLLAIAPGVIATVALWLIVGAMFGRYLAEFASAYSVTYAGLASPMIALVFLYWSASVFLYGAQLNSVISQQSYKPTSTPG
jgi:membrane protein